MKAEMIGAVMILVAAVAWCSAAAEGPVAPAKAKPAGHNNPLGDPNFVPIAVNVQNIMNARTYRDAGINVYVDIDDITETPAEDFQSKPVAATLDRLTALGIYAMVNQDVWGHLKAHPAVIAWLSPVDEPDNVQSGGKAIPLETFLAEARKIKAFDATHPYTVCFGQGVINDLFKGRGIERSEYPKYMAAVDFIMYDVYPITNSRRPDGENYLELTGQGVSRIRGWTANSKPVMCWIETTQIKHPTKKPTPAQTNCEVWITMVHGARGVGYFCHDFTLESRRASALSRDKAMLAQLKKTNGKLMKLARVVNAPLAADPVTIRPQGGGEAGRVIASTKKVDGATVVLSVNVLGMPARKVAITVAGLRKGARVEVLEEDRTIEAADGTIVDDFAPYQEHIYRIRM